MLTKVRAPLLALQLLVAVPLAAVPLAAQAGLKALFPAQPTGRVTDQAGILEPDVVARVEARLLRLRDSTGGEIAVVTLPTLADYAPAMVANEIGRAWGVGRAFPIGDPRRNAAAVLLLVPRTTEHRGEVFISSGNGAEGFLTDARAGQIRDAMLPALRDGDYGGAVDLGTTLLTDLFARALGSSDSSLVRPESDGEGAGRFIPLLVLVIVIAVLAAKSNSRGGGSGRGGRGGSGSMLEPILWGLILGGRGGGFGRGGFGGGGGGGGGGFGGFGGGGGFSGGGAGGSF